MTYLSVGEGERAGASLDQDLELGNRGNGDAGHTNGHTNNTFHRRGL